MNGIKPSIENHQRSERLLKVAAQRSIPRGHRKAYIPGWNEKCEEALKKYEEEADEANANDLVRLLDYERR